MRSPQNLHSQEDGECSLAAGSEGPHCPVGDLYMLWVVGPKVTLGVSLLYLKADVVSISAGLTAPERACCSQMQCPQTGQGGDLMSLCSCLCSWALWMGTSELPWFRSGKIKSV